jgi:hypothetical protein
MKTGIIMFSTRMRMMGIIIQKMIYLSFVAVVLCLLFSRLARILKVTIRAAAV